MLQKDTELQEIVQLVGPDALQDAERLILEAARMIKEVFLQQNAFSDDDAYSSLDKTHGLLDAVLTFYEECQAALGRDVQLETILGHPIREEVARLRELNSDGFVAKKDAVMEQLKAAMQKLVEDAAA